MTDPPAIPGPHPHPHRPTRLELPAGSCDAHCHIFGPARRFPFAADRAYTPPDAPLERFEALQDRLGLQRAVFVQASCHGTDNAAIADALERGRGRYAAVAMIDDATTDVELEELHRLGVRGIRFNFVAHLGGAPDQATFERLVARVVPFGWHIVVHLDAQDLGALRPMLDRLPVPFLIDHMARINASAGPDQTPFRQLLELLTDARCWVKISGAERLSATGAAPYHDVVPFARALVDTAPTRILWGTDWPHPNVRHIPDDGDLVDLLADLLPDPALRQQVLVDNPARLYPFTT
ncbi:MAG: amidohydrolase family protein [Acidimicrobiales bacterium]